MTPRLIERRFPGAALLVLLSLVGRATAAPPEQERAVQILGATGVKGGLVVHVGCGEGGLTAALRVSDSYLVQGLDVDAKNVANAREHIRSLGLEGEVSAARFDGRHLPYLDNLVNLLMAEDPAGVSPAEMLRVLAPLGVAYVQRGGKWTRIVKPRPEQLDEWTHYLHEADGNAVAQDTAIGPPQHVQWVAAPNWSRNHHKLASLSAVVSAAGRVFSIVDDGPSAAVSVPGRWSLVARDAFNGVLLWARPMASWAYTGQGFRSGPVQLPRTLVAAGDRVYAPLGMSKPVSALDAATGKVVQSYPDTKGAEELVFSEGILLVVTGTPFAEQATIDPVLRGEAPYPNAKTVVAVRADSGEVLWKWTEPQSAKLMPLTLAAADRRVFFLAGKGVVCLDRDTGKVLWNSGGDEAIDGSDAKDVKRKGNGSRGPGWSVATLVVHAGVALLAADGQLAALSAAEGKQLWTCACPAGFRSPADVFVIDGLVWTGPTFGEGRDLRTGEIKRTNAAAEDIWTVGHHHRCYREKATSRYLLTGKRGIEFLDLRGNNHTRNNWIRGACQYGILPANGLIYAPSHACGCFMEAKLYGFWAVAAERQKAAEKAPEAKPLERGPAYGTPNPKPEAPSPKSGSANPKSKIENPKSEDWPTYRYDSLRSGSTEVALPAALKSAWQTRLGGRLSSPVVAGGIVVASAIDAGRVVALDAADGKVRWSFPAGGRVDSPPTIYQGRVLFGCADGWVYCLRATDGQVVWRFRAAPAELSTVAFDQVESVWPAHGSVLVEDNVAYVAAGRSAYLDGGIRLYGLDPATGRALCQTTVSTDDPVARSRAEAETETKIAPETFVQNATDYKTFTDPDHSDAFSMGGTTNDVLVSDGNSVFLRQLRFDRKCIQQETPSRHLLSTSSLLDDAENHRSHWVLGTGDFSRLAVAYSWIANSPRGAYGMRLAVPYGLMLAFDSASVWGVRRAGGYTLFGEAGKAFSASEEPLPDFRKSDNKSGPTWKWSGKLSMRPRAMLRAGDVLVLGGMPNEADAADPYAPFEGRAGGLVWTVSAADGTRLAEHKLDSPPVWDGMAAAGGRLYVATMAGTVLCMERDASAVLSPVKLPSGLQTAEAGAAGNPGKPVEADADGKFVLYPALARTTGGLRYQPDRNNLGGWTNSADHCEWALKGVKAGTYAVEFAYGSTNPGIEYTLTVGDQALVGKTEDTGGIKTYKSFRVGTIALPAGDAMLTLKPGPFKGAIMNFRLLTLSPVR